MRNVYVVLAAAAVALGAATAPAFAHDSQSLRSMLVDGGHDVADVPAEIPAFEKRARIARLDECALRAVRASTYQPETIDGRGISGRYLVEVVRDPGF